MGNTVCDLWLKTKKLFIINTASIKKKSIFIMNFPIWLYKATLWDNFYD